MEDDFVEVEKNATITRDLDSLGLESMPAHVEGSASPSAPADSASPSQKDTDSNSSVSGTISALQFLKTHPFVKSTLEDKVYGCIVGSALGDTIGLYTEFLPKAACESAYPDRRFSLTDPVTEPYQDQHRRKCFGSGAGFV